MTELKESYVCFEKETHTYHFNGKTLKGITGLIKKHLFPNKYDDVPEEVLRKAAEKGTFIHEVCELIDDLGIEYDLPEAKGYKELKDLYGLNYERSEYLISDNENVASCIDKVYRESETEFSLGDIKTTSKFDREYVRWQLSIYAYLFERQNPETKVVRLFGIWLKGEIHQIIEVERIPDKIIEELLSCDAKGELFVNPIIPSGEIEERNLPEKYMQIESEIAKINEQAKYWSDKKKELIDGIRREMVNANVLKWIGEKVSFTRKKDTLREDFDKKRFKDDYPDLYNQYLIQNPVLGSVTLKTK